MLVGLPGYGWRGDLRGDDTVVQGSRTYVPVIPEAEWYRAEAEQTEVFAPLVPVERVWVETVAGAAGTVDAGRRRGLPAGVAGRPAPPRAGAGHRRGRADRAPGGPGRRRRGERRDLRAVTELHSGADGDICVRVATELEWYRWAWSGKAPKTLEVPVHLLWVE